MPDSDARLAELLGALSLACDTAYGFPPEKVMRGAVLSVELGRLHGLPDAILRDAYYATLLGYAGCAAFAHEEAHYKQGDDIGFRNAIANVVSDASPGAMRRFVRQLGKGAGFIKGSRSVLRVMLDMNKIADRHARSMCETSERLAAVMGMSESVRAALKQLCERWDGKGSPRRLASEAIALPMRVSHVADFTEMAHHRAGRGAALALLKKQAGHHFDPELAETFLKNADVLFAAIEGPSVWERFLAAEPRPHIRADATRLEDLAHAFAQAADLKSVWMLGHSTGVATLVTRAAEGMGLPPEQRRLLRLAALLHDIGRLGVSNRIWDKDGSLSESEWELVRLHAYWTERVLSRTPLLAEVAQLAAAAHERLDGSGYHRALPAQILNRAARLLAAADAYHALREPRAYRPPHTAARAAEVLVQGVSLGHFDRDAVNAVLDAAGAARKRARGGWPCRLSDREVAVLCLLARGHTNKGIARELGISPRTAQHHVIHIYEKIGVSSRAAAALFATEHGLLEVV